MVGVARDGVAVKTKHTANEKQNFLKTELFYSACNRLTDSRLNDEQQNIVDDVCNRLRGEWETMLKEADADWEKNGGDGVIWSAVSSGSGNAIDTANEGLFEDESAAYYQCAIASAEAILDGGAA